MKAATAVFSGVLSGRGDWCRVLLSGADFGAQAASAATMQAVRVSVRSMHGSDSGGRSGKTRPGQGFTANGGNAGLARRGCVAFTRRWLPARQSTAPRPARMPWRSRRSAGSRRSAPPNRILRRRTRHRMACNIKCAFSASSRTPPAGDGFRDGPGAAQGQRQALDQWRRRVASRKAALSSTSNNAPTSRRRYRPAGAVFTGLRPLRGLKARAASVPITTRRRSSATSPCYRASVSRSSALMA